MSTRECVYANHSCATSHNGNTPTQPQPTLPTLMHRNPHVSEKVRNMSFEALTSLRMCARDRACRWRGRPVCCATHARASANASRGRCLLAASFASRLLAFCKVAGRVWHTCCLFLPAHAVRHRHLKRSGYTVRRSSCHVKQASPPQLSGKTRGDQRWHPAATRYQHWLRA